MKKVFLLMSALFLTGCTYAGPYVTNISRTKSGDFKIEKCMVEHNILGTVSTKNCTTDII
ncbi:MAG: hypothetical protein ACI4OR_04770 [Alphaproteobacteria bacterium]